jgi:hypothetical protein
LLRRLLTYILVGNAFLDPESIKDRHTILISQTCTPDAKNDLERTLIAYRLAAATQKVPTSIAHATPFSSEIFSLHEQVVKLIEFVMDASSIADDGSSEPPPLVTTATDTCDLCEAPIPLVDLNTAACANGHQFSRCGLSFVAIQAPAITKTCGICNTSFLNEEFVEAQEEQEDGSRQENRHGVRDVVMGSANEGEGGGNVVMGESIDPENSAHSDREEPGPADEVRNAVADGEDGDRILPVSFARVLFLACDVCIYCGGKFS